MADGTPLADEAMEASLGNAKSMTIIATKGTLDWGLSAFYSGDDRSGDGH